jgi:hypothetical protein
LRYLGKFYGDIPWQILWRYTLTNSFFGGGGFFLMYSSFMRMKSSGLRVRWMAGDSFSFSASASWLCLYISNQHTVGIRNIVFFGNGSVLPTILLASLLSGKIVNLVMEF